MLMCEQTIELFEGANGFLGPAARVDEFHCQDLSAIQTLSQWAALFVESLLELLFSLQVVLQSWVWTQRWVCAFVAELTQAQITCWPPGMWSDLVLADPSENGNLHCQNYWSIQWLQGVQQAADRFEPSEWEGTLCFTSPAILISALPGWGRGNASSWRSSCGSQENLGFIHSETIKEKMLFPSESS